MRKIILLLVSLVWLGFWWWWYTCTICTTCGCHTKELVVPTPAMNESGILLFNLNDTNAIVQPGWLAYRDSLLSSLSSGQVLEIEGHYLADEPNTSSFENLGIARAYSVKKLFPDSLQNRIALTSLQISRRPTMSSPFVANKITVKTITEKIEQSGDKTLIYFKYNSNERLHDEEIEKYLSDLALQQKDTRSAFNITGHTDNKGHALANIKLGLLRAEAIKNYLVSKGITPDRITTKSLGDSAPIGDNNTAEGRQKNRRTEIEIIQKQ